MSIEPTKGTFDMAQERFEQWGLVEVMGHRQYAGLVTEAEIGGGAFIRVDIPDVEIDPGTTIEAFSVLLSPGSIFAITPTTEATARMIAGRARMRPLAEWDIEQAARAIAQRKAIAAPMSDSFAGNDDYDE